MQAWRIAFEEQTARYDEAFLNSLKGMKDLDIVEVYNSKFKTKLPPKDVVAVKHNYFNKHINSVKPIDRIVNISKQYHGLKPMAVVSGSIAKIVHQELKIIYIFELFETIITADDPFKPKPDPESFLEAANRIQVSPEDIIVFEDGDTGLDAARNAGMQTVDVRELGL
jgi:HAD superfamily hydrolase (TIGR01509 family)